MIFDVSTDRGIRSGNQSSPRSCTGSSSRASGTPRISTSPSSRSRSRTKGRLDDFEASTSELFEQGLGRREGQGRLRRCSEASRVMHELDPATYPTADSWVKAVKDTADITAGKLAERATELMKRRRPGQDLAVRRRRGRPVRRPRRPEDARPPGRRAEPRPRRAAASTGSSSPRRRSSASSSAASTTSGSSSRGSWTASRSQVHLEPSDISEVTSKRVLVEERRRPEAALGKLSTSTAAGSPTTRASPRTSSCRS